VQQYVRGAYLACSTSWAEKAMGNLPVSTSSSSSPLARAGLVAVDLSAPLAHEALVASSSPSLTCDIATSPAGIAHQVLLGPPLVGLAESVTTCGWQFGGSNVILSPSSELPTFYRRLCGKCFADKRASLKASM
jgi:hypothetical protein